MAASCSQRSVRKRLNAGGGKENKPTIETNTTKNGTEEKRKKQKVLSVPTKQQQQQHKKTLTKVAETKTTTIKKAFLFPGDLFRAVCSDQPRTETIKECIALCRTQDELEDTNAFYLDFHLLPIQEAARWCTGDDNHRQVVTVFWAKYKELGCDLATLLQKQDYRGWNLLEFAFESSDEEMVCLVSEFYREVFPTKDDRAFLKTQIDRAKSNLFSSKNKNTFRKLLNFNKVAAKKAAAKKEEQEPSPKEFPEEEVSKTNRGTKNTTTLQEVLTQTAVEKTETSEQQPDPVRILRELASEWPKTLTSYWKGLEMAVQVADRYYREYYLGGPPSSTKVVAENERPIFVVIPESHARTDPFIVGLPTVTQYEEYMQFWKAKNSSNNSDVIGDKNMVLSDKMKIRGHLNLVDSITYGENTVRKGYDEDRIKTMGTPVFWKFLSTLSGEQAELTPESWPNSFRHLIGGRSDERIRGKLALQTKMKRCRVKLLDVTPATVFLSSGTVTVVGANGNVYNTPKDILPQSVKMKLLTLSFQFYTKPILEQLRPLNFL